MVTFDDACDEATEVVRCSLKQKLEEMGVNLAGELKAEVLLKQLTYCLVNSRPVFSKAEESALNSFVGKVTDQQSTKRARLEGDATSAYMRDLLQPELEKLPSFTELRAFVNSDLKGKLVCLDSDYLAAIAQEPLAQDMLVPLSEVPKAQALARVVSNVLQGELCNVEAEDTLHHDADDVFVKILRLAKNAGLLIFKHERNASDSTSGTTSTLSRPDLLVWVGNALLLKGEEKKNAKELGVAESEIMAKMTSSWDDKVYGECRGMFAYALAGNLLELYAIEGGKKLLLLRADMSTLRGKLEVLRATVNMTHVLCAMSKHLPSITWGVGQQFIVEDDGKTISTVTNMGDFVRKELMHFETHHSKYATLEFLRSTYTAVARAAAAGRANHLVYAKKPLELKGSKLVIETAPVGVAYSNTSLPSDEQEAKLAIAGAVKGCSELHALEVGHGDPRFPNLVKVIENGVKRIKIIDYEKSVKLDAECTASHYPLPHWRYDDGRTVLEPDNKYSARSDFRMIGKELMARLQCLSPAGQDLRRRLEHGEYQTAAEVLAHEWFNE